MIPNRLNPMGFSPWRRMIDSHTRCLLYGELTDRASGVTITNYGLQSDGSYVYATAQAPQSYAEISGAELASDVLVSGAYPWTVEIEFTLPDSWTTMPATACLFGWYTNASRFDIIIQKTTQTIAIGGKLSGVTGVVPGHNTFTVQKDASGNWDWLLNGAKTGSVAGAMQARGNISPLILWDGRTSDRYGYPVQIKYIRISNCLRLT